MANAKKISDVSHPGETAPSGNSKSVIITKRPVIQDPMVVADSKAPSAAPASSPSANKKTIKPLDTSAPEAAPVDPAEISAAPAAEAAKSHASLTIQPPKSTAMPETAPEPTKPQPVPATPSKPDDPSDTLEGDKGTQNEEAQQAAEAEVAQQNEALVQKLISSKEYYLPIRSDEQRRTARTLTIGIALSILLAALWFDVALDSGIVHIDGMKSLTHFFSS